MATEQARLFLDETIKEQRLRYSDLSRLIGKNPAYIQQFIKRGSPRRLDEQDRKAIARFLGVSEHLLSGMASSSDAHCSSRAPKSVPVPRLSFGASRASGKLDVDKRPTLAIDNRWLREMGAQPPYVSVLRIDGESMAPTLRHGDDIIIDHSDAMTKLRDGVYVLRLDDVLMVRRISLGPRRGSFSVLSDNRLHPSWTNIDPELVTIVGRVLWVGHTLR